MHVHSVVSQTLVESITIQYITTQKRFIMIS